MDGFTRLASGGCPPLADMLLALAAAFRPVDARAADGRLDELALPLFGGCADLRGAAVDLASVLGGFAPDRLGIEGLWLDAALAQRSGHPLILAAIAAELGRRAGLAVHVLSSPTGWYAAVADSDRLWLVDTTMDGHGPDRWRLRRHCAHEVGFAALLGLSERFERLGDTRRASQATLMRSRLPLFDQRR